MTTGITIIQKDGEDMTREEIEEEIQREGRNSFVWVGTRIGLMLNLFLFFVPTSIYLDGSRQVALIMSFVLFVVSAGTVTLSIIHLTRYDKKGWAIFALVVSGITFLLYAIGFLIGLIIGLTGGAL